jgi:hypothetical protein
VLDYGSYNMYSKLSGNHGATSDPRVMGTCKKLSQADCGKAWGPCGAAAAKLGCSNKNCEGGSYCASPGDTRLGSPRCLPLPSSCGRIGNACCPANKDGSVRERSFVDKSTPVPFCEDGQSFCVWAFEDFDKYGTAQFPTGAGEPFETLDPQTPNPKP